MSLVFFFKLKKDTICINKDRYSLATTGHISNRLKKKKKNTFRREFLNSRNLLNQSGFFFLLLS